MTLHPTNRTLLLTAALITPLLGVAGWLGQSWLACGMVLLVLGLFLAIDAWWGHHRAAGIKITLEGSLHATQGRELDVTAQLWGGRGTLQVGVDWPDHCETPQTILKADLDHAPISLTWPVTPHQRGEILIDAIHHECLSPLGLWGWRGHSPAKLEVRVYPALLEDRGVLAPLFLRRPASGLHVMRQIGKGREFEQLREYLPGDSYEDVDWKSTARRGKPITKVHQIERTQDVYIIVDASRRSQRQLTALESSSPHPLTQLDRFVRGALALALTALQQGDRPGLAVFGPAMRHFLRAGGGQSQYAALRDELFNLQARSEPPDFADFFADLGNRLRQRALLLFLTDLDDPLLSEQFCEEIESFARHHVVLVGQLSAPGIAPVFAENRQTTSNDTDVVSRLAGHLLWEANRRTGNRLRANGIHWVSSTSESLISDMVSAYINIKRRQLL